MKLVRIYIAVLTLAIAGYGWAAWNGYRILGDDNESQNSRSRARGGHYFYHK